MKSVNPAGTFANPDVEFANPETTFVNPETTSVNPNDSEEITISLNVIPKALSEIPESTTGNPAEHIRTVGPVRALEISDSDFEAGLAVEPLPPHKRSGRAPVNWEWLGTSSAPEPPLPSRVTFPVSPSIPSSLASFPHPSGPSLIRFRGAQSEADQSPSRLAFQERRVPPREVSFFCLRINAAGGFLPPLESVGA